MEDFTSVPKFSSFKRKAHAVAPERPSKVTRTQEPTFDEIVESDTAYDNARHRHKHHPRHGDDRSRRSDHEHDGRRSNSQLQRSPTKPQPRLGHNQEASTGDVAATDEFGEFDDFIVDRRGDAKNLEYGSMHRYSIPPYHRCGYGRIVGTSTAMKIDRSASDDKTVVLLLSDRGSTTKHERVLTSKRGKLGESRLRIVPSTTIATLHDLTSDFIAFRSDERGAQRSDLPDQDDSGRMVDYRSIEGKAKPSLSPLDHDLEFMPDEEPMVDEGLVYRKMNAVLSKQARTTPASLDYWLALVKHQNKLVRSDKSESDFSSGERRVLADFRITILQEATKTIAKGHTGRERLLLSILEEGQYLWDSSKLQSKWREALAECPTSSLLCTRYLDFIQTNSRTFRYADCEDAYKRCLKILHDALHNDDPASNETEKTLLYILLRYTVFIRDAGYGELANSTWQAVIEVIFFTAADSSLSSFGNFWDSEAPRVGEERSQGWKRSQASGSATKRGPAPCPVSKVVRSGSLRSFGEEEARADAGLVLPASIDDDDDETMDPFRCVMFSDLHDVLNWVPQKLSKSLVLDAVLCFFGLPPLPCDSDSGGFAWGADIYRRAPRCSTRKPKEDLRPAEIALRFQVECVDSLFDTAFDAFAISVDTELANFINRLLTALVDAEANNDTLAVYFLAFKQKLYPQEARKTGKQLLKNRPSSLPLYNAYALIEASNGRMKHARDVWEASLGMRNTLGALAQADAITLRLSAAVVHIKQDEEALAIRYLLDVASEQSDVLTPDTISHPSPSRVLSAKRELDEGFDRMVLTGRWLLAATHVDCLALLTYLLNNHDLEAAFATYDRCTRTVQKQGGRVAHKLLLQAKARLTGLHLDHHRPYRPSAIIDQLRAELLTFNNNSMLLDLNARIASQDRLRSLVREQKWRVVPDDPISWSYKLAGELARSEIDYAGSTTHTIRAVFSTVLNGDGVLRHAPVFWQTWLEFEASKGDLPAAKQVFLDGLRNIPWHKAFVLQGMQYLAKHETTSRSMLMQVHETLVERGLRVRTEITET